MFQFGNYAMYETINVFCSVIKRRPHYDLLHKMYNFNYYKFFVEICADDKFLAKVVNMKITINSQNVTSLAF